MTRSAGGYAALFDGGTRAHPDRLRRRTGDRPSRGGPCLVQRRLRRRPLDGRGIRLVLREPGRRPAQDQGGGTAAHEGAPRPTHPAQRLGVRGSARPRRRRVRDGRLGGAGQAHRGPHRARRAHGRLEGRQGGRDGRPARTVQRRGGRHGRDGSGGGSGARLADPARPDRDADRQGRDRPVADLGRPAGGRNAARSAQDGPGGVSGPRQGGRRLGPAAGDPGRARPLAVRPGGGNDRQYQRPSSKRVLRSRRRPTGSASSSRRRCARSSRVPADRRLRRPSWRPSGPPSTGWRRRSRHGPPNRCSSSASGSPGPIRRRGSRPHERRSSRATSRARCSRRIERPRSGWARWTWAGAGLRSWRRSSPRSPASSCS